MLGVNSGRPAAVDSMCMLQCTMGLHVQHLRTALKNVTLQAQWRQ